MNRVPLNERELPYYTKGEEIFNMVSHIVGGALAVAELVLCVIFSVIYRDAWYVVASAVYGASMVILFVMSSIYHGLRAQTAKKVFQILDHCTIYFMIAGTYTPIALGGLREINPVIGFVVFGVVWAACAAGTVFTAIDLESTKKFSMICYLAMGWCIVIFLVPTYHVLEMGGMIFLILGGLAHTMGAFLYHKGKTVKYMHSIFHLFVILGSLLHFFMILFYVIIR